VDTPGIDIRAAAEADAPLILEFIRALADYEKLSHEVVVTEEDVRAGLFGPERTAEAVLAFWNEEPAGFALFFHNFSTFLGRSGIYLEDLFVKPELRGKGIGKALLAHLAGIARDRNCGRLEWAVLDWNEPSIAFYQSLGAKPMDEWTTYRLTGPALERLAQAARE
jgi:GNAT superfamily N-acetyltransferase